tara:strand:+ start:868 stop:1257 length:390 start_codon:yes stop_codon:yes gene_type:complete
MEFDLDLDESFDWGFTTASADEVDQGKQQSEAINKVVQGSDNLQQQLSGLDAKLEQVLSISNQQNAERLQAKELEMEALNQDKFTKLEKMILPLLQNLAKSSDEPYIYWPKRKEIIQQQMERILKITRG